MRCGAARYRALRRTGTARLGSVVARVERLYVDRRAWVPRSSARCNFTPVLSVQIDLANAGSIHPRKPRARQREETRLISQGRPVAPFFLTQIVKSAAKRGRWRIHVALLTYASHVDRTSRLPAQRVQNISATLTCAAITTAAILESHSAIATDQAHTRATPRGSLRDYSDIL